jgi:pilus assembly protein TadC
MTWTVAALLAISAFLIGGGPRLTDPIGARLTRLVPFMSNDVGILEHKQKAVDLTYHLLKVIDPTLASSEPILQFLGLGNRTLIVTFELSKLAGAALAAVATYWIFARFLSEPLLLWLLSALAFIVFAILVNKFIASASSNRRKAIRRELALGIEMLCIFLEGGQSLIQAFHAFSDVAQEALPHIARMQRTLVAELENGVPYEKAMENWAAGLHADEAGPLASLFMDSLTHGTELVPHLRQFSLDLIEQRVASARASIGAKSSQLTVVMVLFFLPTILAFVITPAAIGLMAALEASQ